MAMTVPVSLGEVLAGKYRVERVVGAGGMGVVIAAWHLHLDERVAIKLLQPEALKEPVLVARFLREGRAAAKIKSEHVARVYDVGTLDSGAPFLVMEYLEGSDLAALVKAQGPLPLGTAVEYVLQACEAFAEAHSIGIVHRDIKPSNLFVTLRHDGSPVVKVIDFGISKVAVGTDAGMDITKTAEMRGSVLFMPPEQMTSPRDADARSDIWSIGVSLHHLLTGSYPFQASTVPELCGLIFQREPASIRATRPDAPAGLEACVLRCLRKDPAERYQDIGQLALALGEFAPPSARLSVDRIRRMLPGAGQVVKRASSSVPAIGVATSTAREQAGSEPLPLVPGARLGGEIAASGARAVAVPNDMSAAVTSTAITAKRASPGRAPIGAGLTDGTSPGAASWGKTQRVGGKRSGASVLPVVLAALLACAVVVLAIFALRQSGRDAQSAAPTGAMSSAEAEKVAPMAAESASQELDAGTEAPEAGQPASVPTAATTVSTQPPDLKPKTTPKTTPPLTPKTTPAKSSRPTEIF